MYSHEYVKIPSLTFFYFTFSHTLVFQPTSLSHKLDEVQDAPVFLSCLHLHKDTPSGLEEAEKDFEHVL